jgi:ABC-2 type transport system permease protein
MTAAVQTRPAAPERARRPIAGPSMLRLTEVELRKMSDTRAGRWLLALTGLVAVAVIVIMIIVAEPQEQTFRNLFQVTLLPIGILLPVLGILSATSEWTQRTALTTFALVPCRLRVATAKVFATLVLGLLSLVAALAAAAVGTWIAGMVDPLAGDWTMSWLVVASAALFNSINVLMGLGFGMLLMNSPVAIVVYFVLPMVWGILGGLVRQLERPAQWLDTTRTMEPLLAGGMDGTEWARLGVSVGVWVLLPLVAGAVRLMRREIA